jgi:hypothetical protein
LWLTQRAVAELGSVDGAAGPVVRLPLPPRGGYRGCAATWVSGAVAATYL